MTRLRADQGNVSVMFGLMVATLFALGALMVDAATLYVEGRQLQNGAENSALAIARTCATTGCAPAAGTALANQNARDGATSMELVCGTAPGLSACPSEGTRARYGCRPVTGTAPYVQVQTLTQQTDGTNLLPGFFIRMIDDGYAGTGVRACARAAYGSPTGMTSELPLALSGCELDWWQNRYQSLFGTKFVTPPYPSSAHAVLYFHNTGELGLSDCPNSSPSNANPQLPGGFGWLTTTAGACQVATDSNGDAYEKPGNSVPNDCTAADFTAMLGQVVHVPVFGTITNSTGKYDIVGYASFYLTGYRLSGSPAYAQALSGYTVPCGTSARCISGFFVTDPAPAPGPLTAGPGYGAVGINLAG